MSPSPAWLDGTLYPDVDPPERVGDLGARVDLLARLCAAWDFGVLPEAATVAQIGRAEWREAVDACQLLTSPSYHLVRSWHGLPEAPYLGQRLDYIARDPSLEHV